MNYEGMVFEYYTYDEGLGEGGYTSIEVIEYDPPSAGDLFNPYVSEDFSFLVQDSKGSRIVMFHADPYNEYSFLVKECKKLDGLI